ncbi:MAG: hypothetical protein ACK4ND_10875, partial [Cytophagaceae bacterium]
MKRLLLLSIAIVLVSISSSKAQDLLHYWNFNSEDLEVALEPTSTIGGASIEYIANPPAFWDLAGEGSLLNARNEDAAGNSLRVRNPAGRVLLHLPTVGHENIKLSYATQRTNNGMLMQFLEYSIDGETFLDSDFFVPYVDTEFQEYEFDFSAIAGVANNPNFKVRIYFEHQNLGTSGNNRFDNIALEGSPASFEQNYYLVNLTVNDEYSPVRDAEVTLDGISRVSDRLGRVSFFLQDGEYTAQVSAIGYVPASEDIFVSSANQDIMIMLSTPANMGLIHYWNFNDNSSLDNQIKATHTIGGARIHYPGLWDDVDDGTYLNARYGDVPGRAIRVRNPADTLYLALPTIGFKNIIFQYAANRTASGMQNHKVEYTVDGENYTTAGLDPHTVGMFPEHNLHSFDFSGIEDANHNPNFAIRVSFSGNTSESSGNNRIDNITLEGESDDFETNYYKAEFVVNGNGAALKDAVIAIGSRTIITNHLGEATVFLTDGSYNFTVNAHGFYEEDGSVNVSGANVQQTITLFDDPTSRSLIHYWNFNSTAQFENAISPNVTIGGAGLNYTGEWDTNNEGTMLNRRNNDAPGSELRLRNPAGVFYMDVPTVGFENIILTYATRRTAAGMLKQTIEYSTNGVNYIYMDEIDVTEGYQLHQFDFSPFTAANNNPNFKIRISFEGQTAWESGNNRFDNLTLEGNPGNFENTYHKITFMVNGEFGALSNASISIDNKELVTDSHGRASLFLLNGEYSYLADAQRHDPAEGIATVSGSDQLITVNLSPEETDREMMYYWNFNAPELAEALNPNVSVGSPLLLYENAVWDLFQQGSAINSHGSEAGSALRVRNPAGVLEMHLPTTGYEDIILRYAAHRSGSGMLQHIVEYSVDGVAFTSDGLSNSTVDITTEYQLFVFDFSEIDGAENNQDFRVRIRFEGNTTGEAGNNRFDNLSLTGSPMEGLHRINFLITSGSEGLSEAVVRIGDRVFTSNFYGYASIHLPDGTYQYIIQHAEKGTLDGEFTVAGSNLDLEISMDQAFRPTLTINFSHGGNPVEGVRLIVGD